MSIEAIKLALEALEHGLDYAKGEQFENAQRFKGYEHLAPDDTHSIQLIEKAIKALEEALKKEQPYELCPSCRSGSIYACTCTFKPALQQKQEQGEPVGVVTLVDGKKVGIIYDYSVNIDDDLYITPQPKQKQGEPVALRNGECWPEEVMQQWDYWRKEIANGHKGSAPRDWFEGLSELKLIDTTPPQRKPLTDEQIEEIVWNSARQHTLLGMAGRVSISIGRAIEATHGIKE